MSDVTAPASRVPFVLAALGAFAAGAFWALLTLLVALGAPVSGAALVLPLVLVALYVFRGVQVLRGDAGAARSLLWLHGISGVLSVMQLGAPGGGVFVLATQGLKLGVHVFGAVTAWLAFRRAVG